MDAFGADLRQLDNLDIVRLRKRIKRPKRRAYDDFEKAALKAAIKAAGFVSSSNAVKLAEELVGITEKPPSLHYVLPRKVLVGLSATSIKGLTIGIGPEIWIHLIEGAVVQFGVYGSTTGEIGIYGSLAAVLGVGGSFGAGGVITVILGPPSDLKGAYWGIEASVVAGTPFNGFSPGAAVMFLFSPTSRFLGFAVSATLSVSAFPVYFTVQVGYGDNKPLLQLW